MFVGIAATCLLAALAFVDAPAPPPPGPPALYLLDTAERARAEVNKRLDLAGLALTKGALDEAIAEAEAADTVARRALPASDLDRVRASYRLAILRYKWAMKAGDERSACQWAGDARQASLEANNPKGALPWAKVADAHASRVLPKGDMARERAAVQLDLTRSATARAAKDRPGTRSSCQAALARAEASLPPGDRDRAAVLLAMAEVELDEGHTPEARALLDSVVAESTDRLDSDRPSRVKAIQVLTSLDVVKTGDLAQAPAARYLAEASRLADPLDRLAVMAVQGVAAQIWSRMVDDAVTAMAARGADGVAVSYPTVLKRLDEALGEFRGRLLDAGSDPVIAAAGGLYRAKFQYDLQRIADAEATLDAFAREGGPGRSPGLAGDYWTRRGLIATDRGDFATARDCHDRAYGEYFRARLPQQALALNNLGQLLLRQGDYQAAEGLLREADAFSTGDPALKGDPQRAFILTNLAKCLEGENNLLEAMLKHKEALAIAQAATPQNPFLIVACTNNMGVNRYIAAEFDEAAPLFDEARERAVKEFGEAQFRVAEIDVNRGWLALARGRPEEAEKHFITALDRFRKLGDDHPRVSEALSYLARVRARSGAKVAAKRDLDEAMVLQERSLTYTLRSSLGERDRLAVVQERRVHPESSAWPGVLDTYLELAPDLGIEADEQYRRLLAWKGIVARHVSPRPEELEDDPEVRRVARQRESRLRALRDASLTRLGGRGLAAPGEVARHETEIEALERTLARISPRFRRGAGVDDLGPRRVAEALPPRAALVDVIEIRRFRDDAGELIKDFRYVAFVVRAGRPIVRVDLPESAATVNSAILAFQSDIEAQPHRDTARSGAEVSRMVRLPLLPHLDGVELFIFSGDDLLNFLPIAALPGAKPGSYWIEDLALATVTSAQSLVERRSRTDAFAEGMVIVGGVDYVTMKRLEGTVAEAADVARVYTTTHPRSAPADLISGPDATPDRLRSLLPSRRYAHLATHGYFQTTKAEGLFNTHGAAARFDSGLVLAGSGPSKSKADDLLSADEIGALDLRGTEHVVLSACESGLGRLRAGQGVIGLVEALDRAGVASTLSTLWKVSDDGTVPFMAAYYRNLWGVDGARIGPARALRAAQIEMIRGSLTKAAGGIYAHPFYWAAFVQVGDPEPVRQP